MTVLADRVAPGRSDPLCRRASSWRRTARSISPMPPRASLLRIGAAPIERACSTSWSSPPPAACSPMTRRPGRPASWPTASRSRTASPCRPTAIPCSSTETGRYRIWKIDGRASDLDVRSGSPQARVLLDNLPGYPDNLMRGRDGRIWVGLFKPRNPAADSLARRPFMRKVLLRLPRSCVAAGQVVRARLRHRRGRPRHGGPAGSERRLSRDDRRDRDRGPPLHPQPARARGSAGCRDGCEALANL